jgi:flagellar basal body-associated protein FliL
MNSLVEAAVTIAMAIVGVAILSVLVSNKSQTAEVMKAGGNTFANMLNAATSPVTGGNSGTSVQMPRMWGQ